MKQLLAASRRTVGNGVRRYLRWRAGHRLPQLAAMSHPAAPRIAGAIDGVLRQRLAPEEKAWAERIESLRTGMSTDHSVVAMTDYGAGRPGETRSAEEMHTGVVRDLTIAQACAASKPPFWALLLFTLVREFKPAACIELGTCVGISAGYLGAGLQLNGKGRLVTLEGAGALAQIAERNLRVLGLGNVDVVRGRFQDTLENVAARAPVDYIFIDGHHDEQATLAYFQQILPHLAASAVLVFDDISIYRGMRRAWESILESEQVSLAVDLGAIGICVTGDAGLPRERFRMNLW